MQINSSRLLRITLLSGVILLLFTGAVLSVFFLIERSATKTTRRQDSFSRILREYDAAAAVNFGTEREFEHLNGELDKLEKRAIGVESWLSILKRRRALSSIHPLSMVNYRNSINTALEAYPFSQQIAAIAASALIKNSSINMEAEERLREWLSFFSDPSFNELRLCIHVILGDFRSPQRAYIIPADIFSDGTQAVTMDLAIMRTLRGDYRGASADIQIMLNAPRPSEDVLRFAAEYNYDFGDLLRSAEIFSLIDDEKAMVRQADALYLAGFPDSARSIWLILAESESSQNENSLYNAAVTSEDGEAADFLEKLVNLETASNSESRQFGIIRYSRFLEQSQAVTVLQKSAGFSPANYPFIDLEICKRNSFGSDIGRQSAETWLLLDRHPENEDLYRWAAWRFFFQRRLDEAEILLDRMDMLGFKETWFDIYRALQLMNEGRLDDAEKLLRSVPPDDADWYVYANLGRIIESQRSAGRALEQYELAAVKAQNTKTTARIQLRIARCLSVLNRPNDARRVLMNAVELDPDNVTARLELDRILR